jgi:hypothetical protein
MPNPFGAAGSGLEQHQRALQMVMTNLAQVQQNLAAQLPNVQAHFHVNAMPLRPGQQPLPPFQPSHFHHPHPPTLHHHLPLNQPVPAPNPAIQNLQVPPPDPGAQTLPNSASMQNLNVPSSVPPFQRPSSAPGNPLHRQTASVAARVPTQPAMGFMPPPPPGLSPIPHLPYPFTTTQAAPNTTSQPTVWLASSRNGPEALLFAPGHGYFSSRTQQQHRGQHHHHPTPQATRTTQQPASSNAFNEPAAPQPGAAPAPANVPEGQVAVRPANGALARAHARRHRRNRAENDNEFYAIVFQRIWLFLRLYMFIFVLSDQNTWRRYGLLLLAAIVCLMPRRNPLNNILAAGRRHLDNLIGPQQLPARQRAVPTGQQQQPGQQAAPNAQQGGPASATAMTLNAPQGATNITPEQAARRLVQEQRERNPNILRDTFYRIEQAVALFLASLIPGVGERHVAVREEARREVERARLEAERAREEVEKKRKEEAEKDEAEAEKDRKEGEGKGGESSKSVEKEQPSTDSPASEPNAAGASQDGEARAGFT